MYNVHDPYKWYTGWCFGTMEYHGILWLSTQLGMSSSQLTKSIIFRGVDIPPTSTYTQKYGLASGKHTKNYGKSRFWMGKSTISMASNRETPFHSRTAETVAAASPPRQKEANHTHRRPLVVRSVLGRPGDYQGAVNLAQVAFVAMLSIHIYIYIY